MTIHEKMFGLDYQAKIHRRIIAKRDVIIHCHHYNARLQNTIEGSTRIDGKGLIVSSAEAVFYDYVREVVAHESDPAVKFQLACALYTHLGFGKLDLSAVESGVVTASSSHYVEGWCTGFRKVEGPVCSFTAGFLQGAIAAVTGAPVYVREVACLNCGDPACRFEVDFGREAPVASLEKHPHEFSPLAAVPEPMESNVDEQAIIDAVVGMPIYGNEEGLIPAFGVYLANTPADYYNLLTLRYLEEMQAIGEGEAAMTQLLNAGETCAMNTFRGIMASPEWEGLIKPMVQEPSDELFALVALSNSFGWGKWAIVDHEPGEFVELVSTNGYEAYGALDFGKTSETPQCYMLTGVAVGMMELIYSTGLIEDRFGTFEGSETACISTGDGCCRFEVEVL